MRLRALLARRPEPTTPNDAEVVWLRNEKRFLGTSIERYERVLALQRRRLAEVTERLDAHRPGRCGLLDQQHGGFCVMGFGHEGLHRDHSGREFDA